MNDEKFKVLFVCKKRVDSYGISFGLLNSARMLAAILAGEGIESVVEAVDDANGIDRVVCLHRPTHVIIHALWAAPAKILELCRKHRKVSWNVRVHSKPPFLAMEGIASSWIAAYSGIQACMGNLWMSANSRETNELMRDVFGCRSLMLPNAYVAPERPEGCATIEVDHSRLNVACFGAIRPLKNHYAQAVAAMSYAKTIGMMLDFHVNHGREEQGGDRVVRNLRAMFDASGGHRLVEHSWYPHGVLVHCVLPMMDIGMQVSLTETFNIVAADMVAAGLPTIGSQDIYWMSWLFHADPNDIDNMVSTMSAADRLGGFGVWLNRRGLRRANVRAVRTWKRGLRLTSVQASGR